jgi:hypothetical protein
MRWRRATVISMADRGIRRRRGLVDDALGGALSFLIELGIVLGLAVAALAMAVIVLLLV